MRPLDSMIETEHENEDSHGCRFDLDHSCETETLVQSF